MGSIYEDFKDYCEREGIDFNSYADREGIDNDVILDQNIGIEVTFFGRQYLAFSEESKDIFEKFKGFLSGYDREFRFINNDLESQGLVEGKARSFLDFENRGPGMFYDSVKWYIAYVDDSAAKEEKLPDYEGVSELFADGE